MFKFIYPALLAILCFLNSQEISLANSSLTLVKKRDLSLTNFVRHLDLSRRHVPGEVIISLYPEAVNKRNLALSSANGLTGKEAENIFPVEVNAITKKHRLIKASGFVDSFKKLRYIKSENPYLISSVDRNLGGTFLLEFPKNENLDNIIRELKSVGTKVKTVEFNDITIPYSTDPGNGYLWNINAIDVPDAWKITRGLDINKKPILVAVVDSGVDFNHPDIKDNIWQNPSPDPVDCVVNGQIINPCYPNDFQGWNVVTNQTINGILISGNNNVMDTDSNGHGTAVAGIIAAEGHNSIGMIGVAPQVQIMPVVSAIGSVSSSNVDAQGIIWAAEHGARVINLSRGCGYACNTITLNTAISTATRNNAVVVLSAGNSSDDVRNIIGTNDPLAIIVAASSNDANNNNVWAPYSDFGSNVTVTAPGTAISLVAGQESTGQLYRQFQGTSIAAPHVTAAIALIRAAHPDFSVEDIKYVLQQSQDPVTTQGFMEPGILNVAKAIAMDSVVEADFISPIDGDLIVQGTKNIPLKGTAKGINFDYYQFSYKLRDDVDSPSNWKIIASQLKGPISNDVLYNWDISNIALGVYDLRFQAYNKDGKNYTKTVHIAIGQKGLQLIAQDYIVNPVAIEGNYAAWTYAGNSLVNLYDFNTNSKVEITSVGSMGINNLGITNGNVVWKSQESSQQTINIYNIATKTTTSLTMTNSNNPYMTVKNGKVYWPISSTTGGTTIDQTAVYDIASATKSIIPVNFGQFDITNNTAYYPNPDSQKAIASYDLANNTKGIVLPSSPYQLSAPLSEPKCVVVNAKSNAPDPQLSQILMYNLQNSQTKMLGNAGYSGINNLPKYLGDNKLIWVDQTTPNANEVYLYDTNTGFKSQIYITGNVSGVAVNNNYAIVASPIGIMKYPLVPVPQIKSFQINGGASVAPSTAVKLTVNATNADGTPLDASTTMQFTTDSAQVNWSTPIPYSTSPVNWTLPASASPICVQIINNGLTSLPSCTTITIDTAGPTAPSNLNFTDVSSAAVFLKWSPSVDIVPVTYQVYRSTSNNFGAVFTPIGSPVTGTTFIDTDPALLPGTYYYYYVKAINSINQVSSQSNTLVIATNSRPRATGWAYWQKYYFTSAQLADNSLVDSLTGKLATPANDGVPNLLKFALNKNPFVPLSPSDIYKAGIVNNSFQFVITIDKKAAPLVSYRLRQKTDLFAPWKSNVDSAVVTTGTGNSQVTFTDTKLGQQGYYQFQIGLTADGPLDTNPFIVRYAFQRIVPNTLTIKTNGGKVVIGTKEVCSYGTCVATVTQNVPITITAQPLPGYKFLEFIAGTLHSKNSTITLNPAPGATINAVFKPITGKLEPPSITQQ